MTAPRLGVAELDTQVSDPSTGKTAAREESPVGIAHQERLQDGLDRQQVERDTDRRVRTVEAVSGVAWAILRVVNGQQDEFTSRGIDYKAAASQRLQFGLEEPRTDAYGVHVSIEGGPYFGFPLNVGTETFDIAAYDLSVGPPGPLDLTSGTFSVSLYLTGE